MATKSRRWAYEFTGDSNEHTLDARTLGIAGGQSHGNLAVRLTVEILGVPFGGSKYEVYAAAYTCLVLFGPPDEDGDPIFRTADVTSSYALGFDRSDVAKDPPVLSITAGGEASQLVLDIDGIAPDRRYVVDVEARLLERGPV